MAACRRVMAFVTCGLTAEDRDQQPWKVGRKESKSSAGIPQLQYTQTVWHTATNCGKVGRRVTHSVPRGKAPASRLQNPTLVSSMGVPLSPVHQPGRHTWYLYQLSTCQADTWWHAVNVNSKQLNHVTYLTASTLASSPTNMLPTWHIVTHHSLYIKLSYACIHIHHQTYISHWSKSYPHRLQPLGWQRPNTKLMHCSLTWPLLLCNQELLWHVGDWNAVTRYAT